MNNLPRVLLSVSLAVVTTFGLLYMMHTLVNSDLKVDDKPAAAKIPEIRMPDESIEVRYADAAPDKPPEPEEVPDIPPEPEFATPEINPQALNMEAPKLGADINLSLRGLNLDGEYLPIVKVAPQYPRRAAQRGVEGFCTVEFTVTVTGATRDVIVLEGTKKDGSPTTMFNSASIKAAKKFKYKPRVEDGVPIEVAGVRNRFVYEMAQ